MYKLDIHGSVHQDIITKMTNKMKLCGTIYCPLIALHVSSDIFVNHQELLNCIFTASGNTYVRYCVPVSWENQNF